MLGQLRLAGAMGFLMALTACGGVEADVRDAVTACWMKTKGASKEQVEVTAVKIEARDLTEADRKNSITWKGDALVRYTAFSSLADKFVGGMDRWYSEIKDGVVLVKRSSIDRPICP